MASMMMQVGPFHSFIRPEPGVWLVACRRTGGQFSTKAWGNGVRRGMCPCCGGLAR